MQYEQENWDSKAIFSHKVVSKTFNNFVPRVVTNFFREIAILEKKMKEKVKVETKVNVKVKVETSV